MHAQRKAPTAARSNGRFRPTPIRARVGLAMRPSMNFASMPEAETVLRAHGLSLAPIATSEGGVSLGGASLLATAQASDLDSGALKGLVVPAGEGGGPGEAALADAISRACASGGAVIAFGEGVQATLRALDRPSDAYVDAPAIFIKGDHIQAVADSEALALAADRIR